MVRADGLTQPPKKSGPKHGLGRALQRHRERTRAAEAHSALHTTDVYNNAPVSVTEESDLASYLNTATLAGASVLLEGETAEERRAE